MQYAAGTLSSRGAAVAPLSQVYPHNGEVLATKEIVWGSYLQFVTGGFDGTLALSPAAAAPGVQIKPHFSECGISGCHVCAAADSEPEPSQCYACELALRIPCTDRAGVQVNLDASLLHHLLKAHQPLCANLGLQ